EEIQNIAHLLLHLGNAAISGLHHGNRLVQGEVGVGLHVHLGGLLVHGASVLVVHSHAVLHGALRVLSDPIHGSVVFLDEHLHRLILLRIRVAVLVGHEMAHQTGIYQGTAGHRRVLVRLHHHAEGSAGS